MYAHLLEKKLSKFGIYYGWFIAFMTFITTVFSSAVVSIPQVLIIPLTNNFGWSISDISSAIALMLFILASMAPFGGALMLRLGIPKVVSISGFFSITGLITIIFVSEKWHLFFGIGFCLGLSSGILGLGLAATVATRWFHSRRGLVVGILTSGFAAGQLTFVPLIAWLTLMFGWKVAVLPVLFGCFLCSALFFLFGKSWPAELGLPAYGDKQKFQPPKIRENPIVISFKNLFKGIKHPAFWILATTFFICGFTSTGLVSQHFIPFCFDKNIGIVVASSYLAIMGVFNFLGTMGSGWLSDRYDNFTLLAIYYSFRGLSLIYLPYSNFDFYALSLWAIFFGLDFIATVPPTVRLTSKFFGTVSGPVIFGWIFAAHQYGAAFAAYSAGISRDIILSYNPIFIAAGLACFIAMLLILYFKVNQNKLIRSLS
ncbi:MAG: hypothetical protein CFH01_01006 [Alphaproteobacteria bacterium MarineAlpha2_Bin1]|nr:MAG: hypothetical protein CFH01_01006 [Alphaproteobacteria bacterium MarineAlpha2_Bin1]